MCVRDVPSDEPNGSSRLVRPRRDAQSSALRLRHMKFYYVYILKSMNNNFIYVGFTQNLKIRLRQHNNKEELSTKAYAPFDLIHYEAYRNEKDAKRREEYRNISQLRT